MKAGSLKVLIISLFFVILVSAVFIALRNADAFSIKEIRISTSENVSGTGSDAERIIRPVKGLNIFTVSPSVLRSKLLSLICVEDVTVARVYPDTLDINIKFSDYRARCYAMEADNVWLYMVSDSILVPVTYDMYCQYSELPEIEVNPSYASLMCKWNYDDGFIKALNLVESQCGNNLITNVKYDNNSSGFGRLSFCLLDDKVRLSVLEPVTVQRLGEAFDIVSDADHSGEGTEVYDLYSAALVRRH